MLHECVYLKECSDCSIKVESKAAKIVVEKCSNMVVETLLPIISTVEVIRCSNIHFKSCQTPPTPIFTIDLSSDIRISVPEVIPDESSFELFTTECERINLIMQDASHSLELSDPALEQRRDEHSAAPLQLRTKIFSSIPKTTRVVREGPRGYIINNASSNNSGDG